MQGDSGNHFDMLRLVAALAVFAAHADFLYRLRLPVPFPGHSLGSLAVGVFFFISGYLVQQSWQRDPHWGTFWLKRALRIFPALLVAVMFSVFVVGWTMTTWPAGRYLGAPLTWLNLLNNAAALSTVQTLPGVFESNPFARTVNGSLWTIRYELAMYAVLAAAAWTARGRQWVYPAVAVGLVLLWMLGYKRGWDAGTPAPEGFLAGMFHWRDVCGFGVPFFVGSALAAYAVPARAWTAAIAVGAALGAASVEDVVARQVAVWALVCCGTFFAAFAGRGPAHGAQRRERVDISYGVYIYAFPVQQAMVEISLRQGWTFSVCTLLSLATIVPLALLSWFAVERPCIRLARPWTNALRRSRIAATSVASS